MQPNAWQNPGASGMANPQQAAAARSQKREQDQQTYSQRQYEADRSQEWFGGQKAPKTARLDIVTHYQQGGHLHPPSPTGFLHHQDAQCHLLVNLFGIVTVHDRKRCCVLVLMIALSCSSGAASAV